MLLVDGFGVDRKRACGDVVMAFIQGLCMGVSIFPCGFRLEEFGENPGFFFTKKNPAWKSG